MGPVQRNTLVTVFRSEFEYFDSNFLKALLIENFFFLKQKTQLFVTLVVKLLLKEQRDVCWGLLGCEEVAAPSVVPVPQLSVKDHACKILLLYSSF